MNCPNCNQEMTYQDDGGCGYSIADWDVDYPTWHAEEHYKCKSCGIKCVEGEWSIPKKYQRATDKQVKAVLFIQNQLGSYIGYDYFGEFPTGKNNKFAGRFEPLLKNQCIKFIGQYLNEASQNKERRFDELCEDNQDWFPEYY